MKLVLGGVMVVVVIGTLFGGNLAYLSDWSTPQLVGFNLWTIVSVLGGSYLAYWAFRKK